MPILLIMDLEEHLRWVSYTYNSSKKNSAMYSTSPMKGWNSWNHYHCNVNEMVIRQTADAMVASGLAAAGYQYGRVSLSHSHGTITIT